MSLGHGSSISREGLVLAYDMDNIKSWKGKPTTNDISGGSDRANAVTQPLQTVAFLSIVNTIETVSYSNTRPNVVRYYSSNDTGYVGIGQQFSIQNQLGSVYSYSFDYLQVKGGPNALGGPIFYGDGYKVPDAVSYASNTTIVDEPLSDGWTRRKITYTAGYTGNNYIRFNLLTGGYRADGTGDYEFYFDNFQMEEGVVSPFVNGTRSNTEAILDLTKNETITASSVTYNSNNTFSFNGIDNYINTSIIGPYSNYTIDVWARINGTTGTQQRIFSSNSGGTHCINTTPPINFGFHYNPLDGSPSSTGAYTGVAVEYNTWYHIVATNNASDAVSGAKIYLNGNLMASAEPAIPFNGSAYFGSDRTVSLFSNSSLPVVKIYNRTLTADEVRDNFEAMRGRFGI